MKNGVDRRGDVLAVLPDDGRWVAAGVIERRARLSRHVLTRTLQALLAEGLATHNGAERGLRRYAITEGGLEARSRLPATQSVVCAACGEPFATATSGQRYCSKPACRKAGIAEAGRRGGNASRRRGKRSSEEGDIAERKARLERALETTLREVEHAAQMGRAGSPELAAEALRRCAVARRHGDRDALRRAMLDAILLLIDWRARLDAGLADVPRPEPGFEPLN